MTSVVSVRDMGAIGDSVADDTAAIQRALDTFSAQPRTGCVVFPVGAYRITAPIVYRGQYSQAVRIMGEVSSAGMSGAYLMYDGTESACAVLEIAGGADVVVEHLGLDTGPGGAQYGLYAHHDPTRTANGVGVNHLTLSHVVIGGRGRRPGSACLSIGVGLDGTPDTHQCDDIQIRSCKFVEGATGVVIGNGNVKNFFIDKTALWFAKIGVDYGLGGAGSGVCSIRDCNFLWNQTSDVRMGTGILTLDSCQSEGSGAMLINYGNTSNPANARIVGCRWDGASVDDDTIIKFQGMLVLQGNQLINGRTLTSVPGVKIDWNAGQPSCLISQGNYFQRATAGKGKAALFSQGNGTDLHSGKAAGSVQSFGDYGGTPGAIEHLGAN